MSSSISSSELAGHAFLRSFAVVAVATAAALLALLSLLDPYDTARLTPFVRHGIPETGPRMANASRSRDPAFDAAVIGNSTSQLLSPERLAQTGFRFVQLTVPGTGPKEQAALAEHLFRVRGAGMKLLVVGLDRSWCDPAREVRTEHPFPYWLYDGSDLVYLRSLFRMDSLEFLPRRLRLLAGRERVGRRDGYWDYDGGKSYDGFIGRELDAVSDVVPGQRAAADRALARILHAAPASTRILLVHPPVFDPEGRVRRDRGLAACKAALAAAAAGRPATEVIDFWISDEATRTRALFFDQAHYRRPLAERIEAAIAARLRPGG